jgi:hypothetical protein
MKEMGGFASLVCGFRGGSEDSRMLRLMESFGYKL